MKALLLSISKKPPWIADLFPDLHPCLLPIMNKPLWEFYVDFCVLHGIREIRFVNYDSSPDIEEYFSDGTRWGVKISYAYAKPNDSVDRIIQKNKGFLADEKVFLFSGLAFLHYDIQHPSEALQTDKELRFSCKKNECEMRFLKHIDEWENVATETLNAKEFPFSFTNLDSPMQYFQLQMKMLAEDYEHYTLPYYGKEKGILIGRNVVFPASVIINKPVLLGNNLEIKANSVIGPNVILGNNVIIDSNTVIKDSIIGDFTYIGSNLEIIGKLFHQKKLVEPETNESLEVVDDFFANRISANFLHTIQRKISHSMLAMLILVIGLPIYIPFWLAAKLFSLKMEEKECLLDKKGATIKLKTWKSRISNIEFSFIRRFMLDKFPLLKYAMSGKIYLVGHSLLSNSEENVDYIQNLPYYQPAVFSNAELYTDFSNSTEFLFHDLEYCGSSNLKMDLHILKQYVKKFFLNV
jgi:NDP-sugar pyrophosphorylase family protein